MFENESFRDYLIRMSNIASQNEASCRAELSELETKKAVVLAELKRYHEQKYQWDEALRLFDGEPIIPVKTLSIPEELRRDHPF
jgi:hypothetical protein